MSATTTATSKCIGYARASTRGQNKNRQVADLRAAGVRPDDLYVDHGISGAKASRPQWDQAMSVLQPGDMLVVTTLDRMGRDVLNMLTVAADLKARGVHLRVLNLGEESVNTAMPTGQLLFTIMSGLAETEREVKLERSRDSLANRRAQGKTSVDAPKPTRTASCAWLGRH